MAFENFGAVHLKIYTSNMIGPKVVSAPLWALLGSLLPHAQQTSNLLMCLLRTQPQSRITFIRTPGNTPSDLSGIHLRINFAGSSFRCPTLFCEVVSLESLSKYLCQNTTTTEVQIGSMSQQCWISFMLLPLRALRRSERPESNARAAVTKLQSDSWSFMSATTCSMRSDLKFFRSSGGLCHTSTASESIMLRSLLSMQSSATNNKVPASVFDRRIKSAECKPDWLLVLSSVRTFHRSHWPRILRCLRILEPSGRLAGRGCASPSTTNTCPMKPP